METLSRQLSCALSVCWLNQEAWGPSHTCIRGYSRRVAISATEGPEQARSRGQSGADRCGGSSVSRGRRQPAWPGGSAFRQCGHVRCSIPRAVPWGTRVLHSLPPSPPLTGHVTLPGALPPAEKQLGAGRRCRLASGAQYHSFGIYKTAEGQGSSQVCHILVSLFCPKLTSAARSMLFSFPYLTFLGTLMEFALEHLVSGPYFSECSQDSW